MDDLFFDDDDGDDVDDNEQDELYDHELHDSHHGSQHEFHDSHDGLLEDTLLGNSSPSGQQIARGVLDQIGSVVNDAESEKLGTEMAGNVMQHINDVTFGGASAAVDDTEAGEIGEAHDVHKELKFGAGTCYHCGGTGVSTWISSQTKSKCYYCNGTGVA